MHPLGVLDRQRALLLEYDEGVVTTLDRRERFAGIPVSPKRRTAGADQAVFDALPPRRRELRDQARKVIGAVKLLPMKRTFSRALL